MSSSSFLLVSLGLSIILYHLQTLTVLLLNIDSFTSFPIWTPFISFSSLIAMARTFKTMLNKNGKSGSWRKCFSNTLSIMLAVDLSYIAFIILRYISSMPTFWRFFFYHKWVLNFAKSFFKFFFFIVMSSFYILRKVTYQIYDLQFRPFCGLSFHFLDDSTEAKSFKSSLFVNFNIKAVYV